LLAGLGEAFKFLIKKEMFEMHIANTQDLINFTIKNGDPTYLYFWSHRQKNTNEIDKSCLSQWYPAPFQLEDITYRTAEHYMMAQKALICKHPVKSS
jgi:hypothetical protein